MSTFKHRTKINKSLLLSVLPLCFLTATGFADVEPIHNNGMAWTHIAEQGVTRISVQNDRIVDFYGPINKYTYQNDEKQGQIYLSVDPGVTTPFTVFISTEQRQSYALRLTPDPKVVPSSVVLAPTDSKPPVAAHFEKTTPYDQLITQLISAMANGLPIEGYDIQAISKPQNIFLGNVILMTLQKTYSGANLAGEIFTVQNRTSKPLTVTEDEFMAKGDRAIALHDLIIPAFGTTTLYKVVSRG